MSTEGAENTPEIGSDDWWNNWQQRREQQKADSAQKLKAACPALAALGISSITWTYNGEGDSGSMEDTAISGGGTAPGSIDELKEAFKGFDPETQEKLNWDKLEDCVWQLIPDGFENNAGGYGEVELTTGTNRIQVRHNQRIEETEYEEEDY